MSRFKDWCEKVMPFVVASSNGEVVQASCDNGHTWFDMDECEMSDPALLFDFGDYDYRIKPRTIRIGDFDVPEPLRVAPSAGTTVFSVSLELIGSHDEWDWVDGDCVMDLMLSRGILHSSRDSAIAHAKALIALTSAK